MFKRIAVLGATGSIGIQALDIVSRYPDYFKIEALSVNRNITLLAKQVDKFNPSYVSIIDKDKANEYRRVNSNIRIDSGEDSLTNLVTLPEIDIVLNSIVGIAGLKPTIAALNAGKDVALANKESLVAAGQIVMETARRNGKRLIPVDSEHSAIFQCLNTQNNNRDVSKIYLTASGGPFLMTDKSLFHSITVEQALKHPKWVMGKKISVDSATLMNKGLEVIEARWLFDLDHHNIHVVIHPQSIIHSMVEYIDGSVLSQMAVPDMRLPILYALSFPYRLSTEVSKLDFFSLPHISFEKPDIEKFPCLAYAYEALNIGGTMPAVLNAANEVAVDKFLNRIISFDDIPKIIRSAMDLHTVVQNPDINDIIESDRCVRETLGQERMGI